MTVFDYSMIAMATAVISLVIFMAVMVVKHERRERMRRRRETVWARRDAEAMQDIEIRDPGVAIRAYEEQ
jgi:large-conductance mechanosensitive channel